MSWSISGTNIRIWENWTSRRVGTLLMNEFDRRYNYSITTYITNNTAANWVYFANELLDPPGQPNDTLDNRTMPWVPAGFTHSNDLDGLDFVRSSQIPRTSAAFDSLIADQQTGKDFVDFISGTVSGFGGLDTMAFGLRANRSNQPFLLAQRPNMVTEAPNPEPTTLILFGLGLAGLAARARFRK